MNAVAQTQQTPAPSEMNVAERLEAIAVDIEMTQSVAVFRIGQRLAEARGLFKYDRSVGGFGGWCERRLGFTDRHARNLIEIWENIGPAKSEQLFRLSRSALFQLAAPSETSEVREEIQKTVADKVANGESVTAAEIKALKAKIAERDEKLKTLKNQKAAVDGHNSQLIGDLRAATADNRRLDDRLAELQEELRRATEPGTITLTPNEDGATEASEPQVIIERDTTAWQHALMSIWQSAPEDVRQWFRAEVMQ